MSAMFAFEMGEVSMRSATFELVMKDVAEALVDPADKTIVSDAMDLNCLWVDQIDPARKRQVLSMLYRILGLHLSSCRHVDNEVALLEIETLRKQLADRFPDLLAT
jgi:hypothetical protein